MKKILFSSFILASTFCFAQTELVFVFFKDKPNKAAFYANPLSELSQKSLDRRTNLGIALNDQDAPIEPTYIQNIRNMGYTVTDYSKWLNGVAVNATQAQIAVLGAQTFVQSVESFAKNNGRTNQPKPKNKFETFNSEFGGRTDFNYGSGTAQMNQINLVTLHQQGFTGEGVTIAVLDTGFPTVDTGSAFSRLRSLGKIKGGYNFIEKSTDIYNTSLNTHGTVCMGAIGGYIDNGYVGSAPDADFYLYATESGPFEIPEEELYWIEAAEEADRKGVDLISSSLGYADFFDDTRYNYSYSDMTGSKSFIARGAQIASEKGIIVMAAAGNDGNSSWHYIGTPADNTKVFSVGAVTSTGSSSGFSSYGPNYLGAIKPDASARGTNTATVYSNSVISVSGTSLSTPLAAGGVACFLQAVSDSFSRETVKDILRQKSSLYPSYTDQMGYGILNFGNAYTQYLASNEVFVNRALNIYPNPNNGTFTLETANASSLKIFDMNGRIVYTSSVAKGKNEIQTKLSSGVYVVTSESNGKTVSEKMIVK